MRLAAKPNRDEHIYLYPVAAGIIALCEGDQSQWRRALLLCLQNHITEVKNGTLVRSYEGMICMPGMFLLKLGTEHGFKSDIASDYLPRLLLK